ncbi:uncharacterized protein CELE_F25E5.9 [Caenorhabditis elegans]|uniref:Secreted protein n=1 Tax=Caenorhabditis elegans TaxID=6239 RepID=O76648_CAEEL|nr:Secreted protein [Caenorhabditis elegans]CCD65095.1 Secreted protein [Caenorhabditis elegans]|eukprot:NP_504910.1 Uncharacterized protein CELE_F25E5.9 [Caenorhabditis elegans]
MKQILVVLQVRSPADGVHVRESVHRNGAIDLNECPLSFCVYFLRLPSSSFCRDLCAICGGAKPTSLSIEECMCAPHSFFLVSVVLLKRRTRRRRTEKSTITEMQPGEDCQKGGNRKLNR